MPKSRFFGRVFEFIRDPSQWIWGPGAQGGPRGPWEKPLKAYRQRKFENLPEMLILAFFGSKMGEKKVGIQAPGPPRRDPGRNSVPDPGFKVPNGGMATHLVAKRCDLGSLGVPGPASTPGLIFQIRKNYSYFCRGLYGNLLLIRWAPKGGGGMGHEGG